MTVDDHGARPLSRRERRMLAGSERNLRDEVELRAVARHHRDAGSGSDGHRRPRVATLGVGLGCVLAAVVAVALVLGPGSAPALAAVGAVVLLGVALRRSLYDR